MMKSNLPVRYLYRLRLRDKALGSSSYDSGGMSNPLVVQVYGSRRSNGPLTRRAARPHTTERFLKDFIHEYERFTSVLCAAAMYGCGARCEQEYIRARCWFIEHYYRVAPRLRPYFADLKGASLVGTSESVVVRDYAGHPRSMDALEELFLPQTLKDLLDMDNGTLLPRLQQLSDAIYRCMEDIEKD